ncbi:MAG: acyl carrier protein [Clostridia bacterium]|nr:acyl carrier protein [Clostridia bacterium]
MVMDKVVAMLAEQLGMPASEIKADARMKEDLKADSASIMMLVMDVESEFGIEVEDDAIEKVKTVADMVKYIEDKM